MGLAVQDRLAAYGALLHAKVPAFSECGFEIQLSEIHPLLKPHQRDIVYWAVRKGRAAIFAAFGLGKTFMQLEIARLICAKAGGRFLIIAPLGVRLEFVADAAKLGIPIHFVRRIEECGETGIFLTNYETIRDGKLDPRQFTGISLDEAAVLRGFGGTKTFREFMRLFEGSATYRFVATATPSPNEYIELLAYAAFLDVMDVGEGKTRFFKRDSTNADKLTLHPHKEREWWLWISTWAIFLQRPSDLGHSDEGYDLPPMEIHWHEVPSDYADAGEEVNGQGRLVRNSAIGVTHAAREKRDSLTARVAKLMELRALDPDAHRIIWHDLEDERRALEAAIPRIATVYGTQDDEKKVERLTGFANGTIQELAGKPGMIGTGGNYQRHCAWSIFLGIGFKFHEFIQAVHRVWRFLQTSTVRLDLIYTEAEREIRAELQRKWDQHNELTAQMSAIIREYGLASNAIAGELRRSIGVERVEESGECFSVVNNDCVLESASMPADSVHLILTSIPFATQYEYTPSYNDFGHSESNEQFFRQMDFLTPELLRILAPGRVMAVHVKDRIVPGGLSGLGFETVYPFHCDCIAHYQKHGFALIGFKTIVTDVVRENNQTYRLGWSELCKDGSRKGSGLPEYLIVLRKPPTDRTNGYADVPVVKSKPDCIDGAGEQVPFNRNLPIKPGTGYSRSRWQMDAHGFARSSGDRLLSAEDLARLPHEKIFKLFRAHSLTNVYDHEQDVALAESLEAGMRLPVTFMLLQPQSWHPDVWTDITRMRTLNGAQAAAGREMHLCPMQLDLVDRAIRQYTMEGETVFDPFMGIGTVPSRAIAMRRRGAGVELNGRYFRDAVHYCQAAEQKVSMPTLFDLLEMEEPDALECAASPQ